MAYFDTCHNGRLETCSVCHVWFWANCDCARVRIDKCHNVQILIVQVSIYTRVMVRHVSKCKKSFIDVPWVERWYIVQLHTCSSALVSLMWSGLHVLFLSKRLTVHVCILTHCIWWKVWLYTGFSCHVSCYPNYDSTRVPVHTWRCVKHFVWQVSILCSKSPLNTWFTVHALFWPVSLTRGIMYKIC